MSRMNQSLTINVPVIPYRLNVIFVCDEKVNQQANIFIECLFIDFTPLMEKDCKIYLQFHCTNSVCLSMVYCSVCIRQQLLLIFSRTNYIFRSVRLRIVFSVVNFIITLDNILNRNKIRRRRRKKREKNLKNEWTTTDFKSRLWKTKQKRNEMKLFLIYRINSYCVIRWDLFFFSKRR